MQSVPCVLMRGGSSKGLFFLARDLPGAAAERERLLLAAMGSPDLRQIDEVMPFGRVCQPDDVANVVRFFCSEKASYLTGERLFVWGGGQDWRDAGEAARG